MKYELAVDNFKGPLEKLLELIEGKKMEVTRLSLAAVTADFIAYMHTVEKMHPRMLADFVSIAAKLILIKSHALLPVIELDEEDEEDIADLEERLKLYQKFKDAEKHIEAMWGKQVLAKRSFMAASMRGFHLSEKIVPGDLERSLKRVLCEIEAVFPKYQQKEVYMVSLEEKIKELLFRIDRTPQTHFNSVTEGCNKSEVIVLFLALLHVVRTNPIVGVQDALFGEIVIKKI
jgi:segregation and condensation protein A